jgi:hypothetical protein
MTSPVRSWRLRRVASRSRRCWLVLRCLPDRGAEAKADEKPGRPDFSKAKTVELEANPSRSEGGGGAFLRRFGGQGHSTVLGVRRIYYSDNCSINTAVFCSVACPRTMQAVGGGVLDMSLNAELLFDRPTTQVNRWESLVLSLNGGQANAVPFAVCMRK